MERRWFASSARGLVVAASLLLACGLAVADEGGVAPSTEDQALLQNPPTVQPTQSLDQNFLLLPAYDLDWEKPTTSVKVGDTLSAKLSGPDVGKLPKDLKIQVPPGTPEETDLGYDVPDTVSEDLRVAVTVTKAGHVQVPSLALVDSSGKTIARTNPIAVEVQSVISSNDPKAKEPEPPKPPVSLGLPLATLILIGVLIVALIAGLVYWVVRWSRARRAAIPAVKEPPKPEDEVALAALILLEKKGLMSAGKFKAHYFTISEIIKRYIGARYGFDAAESTTHEMMSYLREKRGMAALSMDSLSAMFERLDLVKFTDHVPVTLEGAELLEEAKKLVLTTRRLPQVAGAGNASR